MITKEVKYKTKGFDGLKSKIDTDELVQINSIETDMLSVENKVIFDRIIESYTKVINGEPLLQRDFILTGHEMEEYSKLYPEEQAKYLVYRYKYNKYPELQLLGEYPPCLQIEPSSICNYRCIMCYQTDNFFSNKSSGHMGYMSLELYKDIIDQVEGNVEAVTLASRGEPLLNRDIEGMLSYSAGKFLGLKINTNASLLTENLSHTILSNIDLGTVVFSLDSVNKEEYEKIRVNGIYEKVIENISRFKKIKDTCYPSSRVITRISGVKMNSNQNLKSMESMWMQYVDQTGFTNYTPWHSTYDNQEKEVSSPCTDLWRRMFVWQDGSVNPCDYDYKSTLSFGNTVNSTISDLWLSNRYNEIRELHKNDKRNMMDPCKRCPMT